MASLQTLRNRGGVIVAIVIGIALLAFVLGDMLTSGSTIFGSNNMNVGQINDTKVTAQEFSAEVNYLTQVQEISSGQQALGAEQSVMIQNQAWESMINKYAFMPAMTQVGLATCDAEVAALATGDYLSPVISQVFANPQTGMFDKNYLISFVQNVEKDKSGRLAIFWNYIKQQIADQAVIGKYRSLIDKAAYVTDFEAKTMAALGSGEYSVRFVALKYSDIADSTIAVSDSDIKAYYESHKGQFMRDVDARQIEYVAFDAIPSQKDYAAADAYIKELAADFTTTDNVVQFATLNSQEPFDSRFYSEGVLTGELGAFAYSATTDQVFGPSLEGDQYTLARLSEVRVMPDSLAISHIVVADAKVADSLAIALRARGADFGAAAAQYSLDTQSAAKGGEVGVVDPQTMPALFSMPLLAAKVGDIVVINVPASAEGGGSSHIMRVDRAIGAGRKVQLATIKYTVEPSELTRNAAYNNANAFAGVASAKGGSGFSKAVSDKKLIARNVSVGANDRSINGLNNSRELARWAYNGKVGEVSGVLEFGDTFVVATISNITPEGVMPLDEVRERVVAMVRRDVKGEQLAEKLRGAAGSGANIEGVASKLGVPFIASSADSPINFQTFMVPEIGYDPAFAGGVTAVGATSKGGAASGVLSAPIVGRLAVYVAEVSPAVAATASALTGDTATTSAAAVDGGVAVVIDPMVEKTRLQAEAEQNAFAAAYQELLSHSAIKDQRYKFY